MAVIDDNNIIEVKLGGRPPIYSSSEELQKQIDEYFNSGVKKRTVILGKPPNQSSIEIEVPTITGLCIFLGFESRQSFYDYEAREGFSYTIKRARLFIENEYEEMLSSGNTVGAIFALKNFGWIDKTEIKHDGIPEQTLAPTINVYNSAPPLAESEDQV